MRTNIFKRLLSVMLLIVIFATQSAWAEKSAKAVYTSDNTALTFYYDEVDHSGEGISVFALNYGATPPQWFIDLRDDQNCPVISTVIFDASFAEARPTSCFRWFSNCKYLKTIKGIENLNTEEVTNMRGMFEQCRLLYSLDLSHFKTSKVTDMGNMFNFCWVISSLDLRSFDTSNVTDMSYMFYCCYGLKTLTIGNFDMQKVTDTTNTLYECTNLNSLVMYGIPYLADGTFNTWSLQSGCSTICYTRAGYTNYTGTNYLPSNITYLENTPEAVLVTDSNYSSFDLSNDYVGYYAINTAEQLAWFRDLVNTKVTSGGNATYPYQYAKAVLTADIDLSTLEGNWIPIGTEAGPFKGVFDGQGHSISGMSILNYTTNYQGLFGRVQGTYQTPHAVLKNFTLSGTMTSSTSGLSYIAGVAGYSDYCVDISDVTSNVNITLAEGTTQSTIGGIAGACSRTVMVRCVNNGNIDAGASKERIGGIQAHSWGYSSATYCLNTGNITSTAGDAEIGGIFGYQASDRFQGARHCLNTGTVNGGTANTKAGAIYGYYVSAANNKGTNNYYLNTSATKAVGANESTDDLTGVCTAVTNKQIVYGETCYKLNGSKSTGTLNWHQTIGTDATPVPNTTGSIVYQVDCTNCDGTAGKAYSNTTEAVTLTHHMTANEATAATCTTAGNDAYWTCSNDCCEGIIYKNSTGSEKGDAIPATAALGHALTSHAGIPAGDTYSGIGDYWTCSRSCCEGIYYKDKNASETWSGLPVIPARLDVNGDGKFSIADLSKLSDVLTLGTQPDTYTRDDVDALSDIVLGKTFVQGNNQIVYYALSQVTLSQGDTAFPAQVNGKTPNVVSHTFKDGMGVVTFDVGFEGVTSAQSLFQGTGIIKVIFPGSMTQLGTNLCRNCKSLTEVVLPKNLRKIGFQSFYFCDNLTKITLPETLTNIDEYAFTCCYRLPSVTVPASVTTLGTSAFSCCYSCDITIESTKIKELPKFCLGHVKNVNIPQGVTRIGNYAIYFYNARNTTKTKLVIPEGVTDIGFIYMRNVEEITFPSSFKNILAANLFCAEPSAKTETLYDPVTLEAVTYDIPESEQTKLKVLNVKAVTPPVFTESSPVRDITNTPDVLDEMIIYVPTGSVEAYKAAEGWKVFADQILGKDF